MDDGPSEAGRASVSGAVSADVLRYQLDRAIALGPDLVTLSVGPNDITGGVPVRDYERNVGRILKRLGRETTAGVGVNLLPDLAGLRRRKAGRLSGGNSKSSSLRGYLLAKTGRTNEAREVLRTLEALCRERYVPPYATALVHAGLGDRLRERLSDGVRRLRRARAARRVGAAPSQGRGAMIGARGGALRAAAARRSAGGSH